MIEIKKNDKKESVIKYFKIKYHMITKQFI